MGIRKRDVHFSDWAKVRDGLIASNVTAITTSSTDEEVRAFLTNTTSDQNPFYYYVVYIKSTQEIYTHGQFYNCSPTDWDDIIDKPELVLKSDHDADIVQLETTKQDQLISGTNIKTVNGVSLLGSGNINTLLQIQQKNYDDLLQMKRRGKLIPGQKYRMYYTATTNCSNTASIGFPMYLILTAISSDAFDPKVTAIDSLDYYGYYKNADLSKWEIWYDIDPSEYNWYGTSYNVCAVPMPIEFQGAIDNPEMYSGRDNYVKYISSDGSYIMVGHAKWAWDSPEQEKVCYWNENLTHEMYDYTMDVWCDDDMDFVFVTQAIHDQSGYLGTSAWINWKKTEYNIQQCGVIYKMIDPYGNEASYDFTSIYFNNDDKWVPTFGINGYDATIAGQCVAANNKIVAPTLYSYDYKRILPNIQLSSLEPYSSCLVIQNSSMQENQVIVCDSGLQVYVDLNGNIKKWYPHELVQ